MNHRELFYADQLPVFQNKVYSTHKEAISCVCGDISLIQDSDTGLVFNRLFNPNLLTYDSDYENEQAYSQIFQHHLDDVIGVIRRHSSRLDLLEIGCGKGYFLTKLLSAGFQVKGVDPAYQGDNPDIIKERFDSKLGICADAIILRHVLEHINDPIEFLTEIKNANKGKGLIYIEVPCFDWIYSHQTWFDIFYEHVNYFRLSDLQGMFGKVFESGWLFGGQYIYIVAELSSLRIPRFIKEVQGNVSQTLWQSINRLAHECKTQRLSTHGHKAIWGGSSKGVIFALHMKRLCVEFDFVVDINPAKQGKFIPGTGLEIISPERALAVLPPQSEIYIMNSNYFEEIISQSRNIFKYKRIDQ